MSILINCSHCQVLLKLAEPVPVGAKVRCPRCKELFTVETPPEAAPLTENPKPVSLLDFALPALPEETPAGLPSERPDDKRRKGKRRRRRKRRTAEANQIAIEMAMVEARGKKAGSAILLLALALVGFLGLFVCILSGLIAYHFYDVGFDKPDIVGVWENDQILKLKTSYEFRRDGVGKLNVGKAGADFTYRLRGSELTIIPPAKAAAAEELRYRVKRIGNTMELRSLANDIEGPAVVYRKIE